MVRRRRIHVANIPEPIRQALIRDFEKRKKKASINDIVASILARRYGVEMIPARHGRPIGTDCDPLILKISEDIHTEVRRHAGNTGCSMRVLVIDSIARHYNLTEFAPPLVRERTYAA